MGTEVKRFTIWEKNGKTTDGQSTYHIVKEPENIFYLEVLKPLNSGEGFYWDRIGNLLGWSSMCWLVSNDTFQNLFIN